ncbi:hypothetical protein SAMN05444143_101801 [Flavobacterium succinicans]|uniref:Uncharacterized protein n=1 Tax=Flavobacterium succinicans TaxID=29536 RepID=A0A1I4SF06_9FLAO|nr:hypothetical protein SAMN05444143_101801 [Flavobacterium succinicans]
MVICSWFKNNSCIHGHPSKQLFAPLRHRGSTTHHLFKKAFLHSWPPLRTTLCVLASSRFNYPPSFQKTICAFAVIPSPSLQKKHSCIRGHLIKQLFASLRLSGSTTNHLFKKAFVHSWPSFQTTLCVLASSRFNYPPSFQKQFVPS